MKKRFPKGIPFIIANEAAERFSYYGMKAILPLFLVAQFFPHDPHAEARANETVHLFVSIAYFTPVLGALAADWFFGKYKVILYVSILYTFGHVCLSLFDDGFTGFILGLMMIAIGAGGIKSNVSANVGDQFDETNKDLLSKIYGWFYFSINAGSVISTILIPWIYEVYGPSLAFLIPGIFMALATIIYYAGNKTFVKVPPSGINKNNFLFINSYALSLAVKSLFVKGVSVWKQTEEKFSEKGVDGIKAVWRVLAVFSFIPVFWALWDQNQTSWVLQAEKLDRTINIFGLFSFTPLSAQIQSINPALILISIPLLNMLFPKIEKMGIKVTPLRKIGTGLFLTAVSLAFIAIAQEFLDAGQTASVWWQIAAFTALTVGEVLVSITGLEYAYTQAPPAMKSTMSAFWLLTVSVGNLFISGINASIADGGFFASLQGATYFWFFSFLMASVFVLFVLLSGKIKEKSYIHHSE